MANTTGNDGAGTYRGLVARFGALNLDGTPAYGRQAATLTKFTEITSTPELHTGKDVELEAADGTLCLVDKLPDFEKRRNVSASLCVDDPEQAFILIGGRILTTGGLVAPTGVTATPSGSGGTLAAGVKSYRVTAVDADGDETLPTAAVTATTTGSTGSVALSWTASAGAAGYHVYGRTAGAEKRISTAVVTATTFTDTGAVASPTVAYPAQNFTGSTIGYLAPATLAPGRPEGVSVEVWTYAWVGGAPATSLPYIRHVWPKVLFAPAPLTINGDGNPHTYQGYAVPNPAWGSGIARDWVDASSAPIVIDGTYGFRREATLPSVGVGFVPAL